MARPSKKDSAKSLSTKEKKQNDDSKKTSKKDAPKKEQLNTFEKVEKKRKNVSSSDIKTEPIINKESETENDVEKEDVLTSILPETEVIDEKSNNVKEELNSIQADNKPINEADLAKIFELKIGAEFLDGHLKIQTEGTKIQRRSEENYHVFGQVEQGAPFDITFECLDREEADLLWGQLTDYEKNPEKYIKEVPKTQQPPVTEQPVNEQPATQQQPIQPTTNVNEAISNQTDTKSTEPEKKIEDYSGVPLNTVNMDELINSMPDIKPQNPSVPNANPIQQLATATNISHLINNQNTAQMEAYGQSIADHINTSFQANIWGAMPLDAAKLFISSCSAEYKYEFKKDDKGYYMELTKDSTVVRIPKKTDEYLKIS